jgi:hypothetical protein
LRAQAQGLSSAANPDGSATRGSVFGRRDNATRASSLSADGSGAPSHRGRLAVLALAIAAFALLAFAPLSQAKIVVNGYGSNNGELGGEFTNSASGIAINTTGAGGVPAGTIYVLDAGGGPGGPGVNDNAARVQRFSPSGVFQRAWGGDVIQSGRPGDISTTAFEICTVAADCKRGILSTTANGGHLSANNAVGGGVAINQSTGHVYVVENGFPSSRRISQFDANGSFIRTWGWDVNVVGGPNDTSEEQTVTVDATGGTFTLTYSGQTTAPIAFDADAATVQSALEGLSNLDPGHVSVTGSAGGPWTVRFIGAKRGVNQPQMTTSAAGLTGGAQTAIVATAVEGATFTGFEICSVATECKEGLQGTNGGQFGNNLGDLTIDSSGNVWVPEGGNRRIQEFDSSGNFIAAYGWGVVPAGRPGNVPGNEEQKVTLNANAIGGTYRLRFGGTAPANTSISISLGASAATVQSALEGISSIGAGNVTVTGPNGGPYDIRFIGALADIDHPLMTSDPAGLIGPQTITVPGSGGIFSLTFRGQTTDSISFGSSAGLVQNRLEQLSTIGVGNVNVTSPNPSGGPYTVNFTGALAGAQPPITADSRNLVPAGSTISVVIPDVIFATTRPGNALEGCTSTAAGDCQAGAPGAYPGQFGQNSPRDIAFNASGNVFAVDSDNRRLQKFDPTLTSATNFAPAAFPTATPHSITAAQGGNRLVVALDTTTPSEHQLVELDPADASVKDTSLVGSGLNFSTGNIGGLAVNDATATLYMTVGSTGSTNSPRPILVLSSTPLPAPVLTTNTVTVKTDTTATFSGRVDPMGGLVSCAFQYSTDPRFAPSETSSVPAPGCASLASSGVQAVSVNATGLIPNTHYFVRLTASRPLVVPTTTTTASATVFDTDSVPPAVSSVGAVEIADTSARLVGTIDPKHSPTGYVFQYGTTPALGSSTPPVDIGSGSAPLIVSQSVQGLRPATTYYFRLVATNNFGTTQSTNKTLLTRTDPVLPGGRAYEMVSPVDKNGGGALSGQQASWSIAYDGEAIGFCTTSMFGSPSSPLTNIFDACANYASQRTADGWQTRSAMPPVCGPSFGPGHAILWYSRNIDFLAMSRPEPTCPLAPLDPAAQPGRNLYREDLFSTPSTFDLLGPQSVPVAVSETAYDGSSYDFSHVVYRSTAQQTVDAPAGSFDKLYEWDNGTPRLVSVSPAGTPFTTASTVAGSGLRATAFGGDAPADPDNGVSSDGERIFFQNKASLITPLEIYMREGGTVTHRLGQPECTVSCPGGIDNVARTFRYATPDGSRVFFTTARKLADDDNTASGDDLYMYRHSANPVSDRNLSVLSVDSEPADGTTAGVLGVVGASDDGETVYFVANGQLVLGAPTAAGPKVYRWLWNGGSSRLDYLTTLNAADDASWLGGPTAPLSVTPDGQHLLILTALTLDTVADTDTSRDFYRWDARSGWLCVSCQRPGVPSAGDAEGRRRGKVSNARRKVTMSDDGRRIFFATPDALVPEDTNGEVSCPGRLGSFLSVYRCMDVYEWHDGKISLVSTGTSPSPAFLLGASHDGRDVFFYSEDRLVGWDTDIVGDIYDARIGGGFPEPPARPVPCDLNAGACEGAPSVAPPITGAGSAAFEGPGNERRGFRSTGRRCPRGKRKVSRNGRTRCVPRKTQAQRKDRTANHNRRAAR